jgi:hypothetical protein
MEFTGDFETHITVGLNDLEDLNRLRQWSANHGLKCLHIVLERGTTRSQPMLTRHGSGTLMNQVEISNALCQALNAEGFSVTRIKIEAGLGNHDVPQSNLEAQTHPLEQYFEHHLKILLDCSQEVTPLVVVVEQHSAHLSRNVLHTRQDNYEERFITQRCMAVGREEAQQQLQSLVDAIISSGYSIHEIQQEFVVYDNNFKLDQGWI